MKKSRPTRKPTRVVRTQPAKRVKTFKFECTSDPKEISKVEPFLMKINESIRLDDGTFYRLLVAGTEAINNGILHGNKADPAKKVHVICRVDRNSLVLRVRDEGRGFKPEEVPDPLEEQNLLKTSGRGIFLMKSLMDKVVFSITPKGTLVELVIDLRHLG